MKTDEKLMDFKADILVNVPHFIETIENNEHHLLQRPLLYLACRHHVTELLDKNQWKKVFKYNPSPDVK